MKPQENAHCYHSPLRFSTLFLRFQLLFSLALFLLLPSPCHSQSLYTSFGDFACNSVSSSSTRCLSASVELKLDSNSSSISDSFSYYYNTQGQKIDLGTTVKFEANILKAKSRLYLVKDSKFIYNKYEVFTPGLGCAMTRTNSDCPGDVYVLCCLGGKRGTGAFCLKEAESPGMNLRRAYQVYRITLSTSILLTVQVKVTRNGKTRELTLTESATSASLPSFGMDAFMMYQLSMQHQELEKKFSMCSNNYVMLRLMQTGAINNNALSSNNLLLVEKLSNFITDQYSYQIKASCDAEYGDQTKTHDYMDHIKDQFYNAQELYGIKNVLRNKLNVPLTETITFGNSDTSGDQNGLDYLEVDVTSPVLSINLLIKNIYDL
ncbi:hypothetical protein C9374_009579 [Naegleria lovaniensis]|uniref:Uncharacterized protein n=1 Tax=Naegleria lovaniensis TaxID=51637 RepID=A0AA88H4Z2_NAELO|nr:uncharacterized protein C9374_009579 [Naegleria lovaniensis]KAG2393002.1 hypothetical protein C9374_009579 [Naegleria lovaniensis]